MRINLASALVAGLALATLACVSTASPTPSGTTALPVEVIPAEVTLIPSASPEQTNRDRLTMLASSVSAERLVSDVQTLAAIPSRHVNSATIGQAAEYIHAQFTAAGGHWRVAYDDFSLAYDGTLTTQRNVVATWPGSDSAAGMILIGAHYDSRTVSLTDATSPAPGADDNATGVAALLEIARLLADEQPRRTLVLAAFSAEEEGHFGSSHAVNEALAQGDDIRAMLALDIIGNAGGPDGEGVLRVFSAPPNDSPSRQLTRVIDLLAMTYTPSFDVQVQTTLDRPNRYSDHKPFSEADIPAARFISLLENTARQHSGADTPEAISPAYLQQTTQLALVTAVNLSNGLDAPDRPVSLSSQQYALAWEPVPEAAGYVVVTRRVGEQGVAQILWLAGNNNTLINDPAWFDGTYAGVSIASVSSDGFVGLLSPELALVVE